MSAAINVEVKNTHNDPTEKIIKKFFKKCRKQDILREYLDKTSFFLTKSQKRRNKRLKNKFLRQKGKKKTYSGNKIC
jgi:ribosomal protein S21